MEIRKNNTEIRKNWNKFSFKKLGAILCLFLIGIVTFISGNLAQVSAATSSTVLPVAKGGTGSNSASGAATNILGRDFTNYSGKLPASQLTGSVPIANGGTGAINGATARANLEVSQSYVYQQQHGDYIEYVRVAMTQIAGLASGYNTQTSIISGLDRSSNNPMTVILEVNPAVAEPRISMLSKNRCNVWFWYYNENNIRYYYASAQEWWAQTTSVNVILNSTSNPIFVPDLKKYMPSNFISLGKASC
ncbi:MAG: hypothetical protein LBT99_01780 [Bifidobacteriaceae bacterium]|jgi:hypothetical protein|nr:hypothetical protein [Bifidobacteriaceae bacterium]